MKYFILFISGLFLIQCSRSTNQVTGSEINNFKVDTLTLFDTIRNRAIPIAIYQPKNKHNSIPVLFSHGYGENQGGAYLEYSYLTEFLASNGYFVISIQHELPTDSLLPTTGKPQIVRRSNWERGAQNIHFVLEETKRKYPKLDYTQLAVVGHSNGGDMTALFAQRYPKLLNKAITLDNRRMELPRTSEPIIFTLRSSDYPADEGVLPNGKEAHQYNITIQLTDIKHNDMDNDASAKERAYIQSKVLEYLKK